MVSIKPWDSVDKFVVYLLMS